MDRVARSARRARPCARPEGLRVRLPLSRLHGGVRRQPERGPGRARAFRGPHPRRAQRRAVDLVAADDEAAGSFGRAPGASGERPAAGPRSAERSRRRSRAAKSGDGRCTPTGRSPRAASRCSRGSTTLLTQVAETGADDQRRSRCCPGRVPSCSTPRSRRSSRPRVLRATSSGRWQQARRDAGLQCERPDRPRPRRRRRRARGWSSSATSWPARSSRPRSRSAVTCRPAPPAWPSATASRCGWRSAGLGQDTSSVDDAPATSAEVVGAGRRSGVGVRRQAGSAYAALIAVRPTG